MKDFDIILKNLSNISIVAFFMFVIGKLAGFGAMVAVLSNSPMAKTLLGIYAFLIAGSIVLCMYDGYRKKKEKPELTKEEVEKLAKQFNLI